MRLVDVAQVVQSAENTRLGAWAGKAGELRPAIIVNVQRQPGANVIATVDAIKKQLPDLQSALPADVRVEILSDRTTGIRASVSHVEIELVLAVVMVVLVIFAFLGSLRATVIASLAVPISLIGTFGAMYLLGYSLNNLSLMALTIATGFVVDDAIVMIENISRHLEMARAAAGEGHAVGKEAPEPVAAAGRDDVAEAAAAAALRDDRLSGAELESLPAGRQRLVVQAALAGASEIGFTIISLTVSLIAVLIPLLFMGDVVGRLFREFAVSLAITILISAVVSLTLVPMMSARWMKADEQGDKRQSRLALRFRRFFAAVMERYDSALDWVIDHQGLTLLVAVATLLVTVLLYIVIPKGLFPTQDTGQLQARIETASDVSYARMAELQQAAARAILQDPAVENLSSLIGVDAANNTMLHTGSMLIDLKPSHGDQADVMASLQRRVGAVPGVTLYLQPTQDLTIDAESGPTEFRVSLEGADTATVTTWVNRLVAEMRNHKELRNVTSDAGATGLAAYIDIDRDTAARLGVTASAVDDALYSAFGQRIISTIFTETNQYRVILEAEPGLLTTADSLARLNLRTASGEPTPLSAIATISRARGAAADHPRRPVPGVDDRLRHRGRRLARQRRRCDPRRGEGDPHAECGAADLPRRLGRLRAVALEPALADPGGGGLRLHRPRRSLRELRAPADDPVDAAVGRRRCLARALDHRQQPRRDRHHRHHSPDRHRQEERDHDDRLRDRGRARREEAAARGDPSGSDAALPADPDDDAGGAVRRLAADARLGRGPRTAPAARPGDLRRPDRQPAADALHDAGRSISPSTGSAAASAACRARRRTRRRRAGDPQRLCRPSRTLALPAPGSGGEAAP